MLVSGGNFLTIAICAHALPLPEQGKFTYIFASYLGLLMLNVAGIFQGAAVRAPAQDESYQITLARLQLLQAVLISTLVSLAWFGSGDILGWQPTVAEIALLFSFLIMQQMADFDRRTAYIFSEVKRAFMSSALLYPGRLIGLILVQPDTVEQVLEVLIVSSLVPAVIAVYEASRRKAAEAPAWLEASKAHLAYSKLFIAGAPLGWLWTYLPIFMLGTMHGKEQAALLASIRSISNIANVLMEQLETKVVTDWARLHHGDGQRAMKAAAIRLLKIGAAFWLLGMIVVAVLGKEIVALVLGSLYAPHWHLLLIGWLGYGVYFLARVSGIKHRAMGANKVEFVGNIYGVAAAIVAGYALITLFSMSGAAWTYVLIAAAMLVGQKSFANK
ncbi:MAG: hypothetical protein KKA63_07710 [Gammaproteobacteria bacterium]|nr:hypothetical protein [Gammaproteobacteria bacterium]